MVKKDYKNWDKDDLIKEIKQLRKRKKYGLVWEDKQEDVVDRCKTELPVLEEVKTKGVITDPEKPMNLLIEGDNYHVLSVLNYTHKGKIDVIYIDPPYNTGARDWKYNNDYVDGEDLYRHTKWLSFMYHRINIAKSLLKPTGILCVTIDDYEMPRLWLLVEEIFSEANNLGVVAIRSNPKGRKTERKVSLIHEYAIFFGRTNKAKIDKLPVDPSKKTHNYKKDNNGNWYLPVNLRKQGVDSLAAKKNGKISDRYFPIYVDPNTHKISVDEKYEIEILPIDSNGQKRIWRRGKEVINKMFQASELWYKKTKYGNQLYFKFRGGLDGEPPQSIWYGSKFSASEHGTQILDKILGEREKFQYPKSPYAVEECIKSASDDKNAVIVDFFAGSGTTGHAVLELNKIDGGNRKFILCTNNENGIAQEVCLPRLTKVIKGYTFSGKIKEILFERKLTFRVLQDFDLILDCITQVKKESEKNFDKIEVKIEDNHIRLYGIKKSKGTIEGLGGNLKYFKTAFVPADPTDRNKAELTKRATEMLCVKEDTFEEVKSTGKYKIFRNKKRYTGIIYDYLGIDDFKKEIANIVGKFSVYVFSLSDDTFDEEFEDVKNKVKLSPIPEAILRVYRRIFK